MNVLIIADATNESNTGYIITNFAIKLSQRGFNVSISFKNIDDGPTLKVLNKFQLTIFKEIETPLVTDLLLAWNPRTKVIQTASRIRCKYLAVHFDDNEEIVFLDHSLPDVQSEERINFLSRMDIMSVINPNIFNLYPTLSAKVLKVVVRPGMDEEISPMDSDTSSNFKSNRPYVVYTGNITEYIAEAMLKPLFGFKNALKKNADCLFLFTGRNYSGMNYSEILPKAVSLGFVKKETLPSVIKGALFGFQPWAKDNFDLFRFPSKFLDYYACETPVVTRPFPESCIGFEMKNNVNFYVPGDNSIGAWSDVFERALSSNEERLRIGKQSKRDAEGALSWSSSVDNFVNAVITL